MFNLVKKIRKKMNRIKKLKRRSTYIKYNKYVAPYDFKSIKAFQL